MQSVEFKVQYKNENKIVIVTLIWWIRSTPVNLDLIYIFTLFLWRITYEYIDSFANEIKDLKYELSSFNNIEEQSVWTNKHAPKIHFIRKFEEEQTNKLEMKEMSIQYGLESISC